MHRLVKDLSSLKQGITALDRDPAKDSVKSSTCEQDSSSASTASVTGPMWLVVMSLTLEQIWSRWIYDEYSLGTLDRYL